MLVLYETAMGYCLFKLTDSAKLESADLYKSFETPEGASKLYVHDLRTLDIADAMWME
jgi:nucleolar protein 58